MDPRNFFLPVIIAFHNTIETNGTEKYPKHLNYTLAFPYSAKHKSNFETNDIFPKTKFSKMFSANLDEDGIEGMVYCIINFLVVRPPVFDYKICRLGQFPMIPFPRVCADSRTYCTDAQVLEKEIFFPIGPMAYRIGVPRLNTIIVFKLIDNYIRSGFIGFQVSIDMAYIQLVSNKTAKELHPRVSQ